VIKIGFEIGFGKLECQEGVVISLRSCVVVDRIGVVYSIASSIASSIAVKARIFENI
jgi:hypothetical protein